MAEKSEHAALRQFYTWYDIQTLFQIKHQTMKGKLNIWQIQMLNIHIIKWYIYDKSRFIMF